MDYKQGKDDRQNCQKPETTLQVLEKGKLTVYVGQDKKSGVYFQGAEKDYLNGATWNKSKVDYFVGEDRKAEKSNDKSEEKLSTGKGKKKNK